ncbi:MAG: 16S rRNA (adenine(1518)-N(6)/adenine(1519)-N(6))-dimethyltransferase RsmA [Patescibacteria group bacterium]|jgi:16S rRNA (adenine1518-N6/adenine1519-N6)-dimethyltransferase
MVFKRSFGQHFLQDEEVIDQIIRALDPQPNERIIEVGPGGGALTKRLVGFENLLVLIEADRDLVVKLERNFSKAIVVNADAAQVNYDELSNEGPWIFVSNLPYNAGNAILEKVFRSINLPDRLVVMVQKEVGERMMAKPGEMSVLSVATQLYCDIEKICLVGPEAFVPKPKVDSVVLKLKPKEANQENEGIIAFAKIGFAHRRKQLRQTLAQAQTADIEKIDAVFASIGLPKAVRPQEISLEDWIKLFSLLRS